MNDSTKDIFYLLRNLGVSKEDWMAKTPFSCVLVLAHRVFGLQHTLNLPCDRLYKRYLLFTQKLRSINGRLDGKNTFSCALVLVHSVSGLSVSLLHTLIPFHQQQTFCNEAKVTSTIPSCSPLFLHVPPLVMTSQ